MRPISADLATVQHARSPRARATVTVEARGQTLSAPPVAWSQLVSNAAQAFWYPTAAVGLADGRILKFTANLTTKIEQHVIADPSSAAAWAAPTTTQLAAHGATSLCALRIPATSTLRLWYVHAVDGKVYYIESSNNGATWGSPVTVYSTGDAAGDLVVTYNNGASVANRPWFFGFSTYNGGTGDYTPRFGYHDGSNWVTHAYPESGWRAAGFAPPENTAHHIVIAFRQQDRGTSRIQTRAKSGATYSTTYLIDQTQAGLFGLGLAHARFCLLPESNAMLGLIAEQASGSGVYLGLCGTAPFTHNVVDEPLIFPTALIADDEPHTCVCEDADGNLYVIGDTLVYRGEKLAVTSATLEPTRYTYDDHQLEIDFAPDADAATLAPGQVLVLTRTLTWNTKSGSESIRFIIAAVERGTDTVRVTAYDPLGYLGIARCRRPAILNDGTANSALGTVLKNMAARVSLRLDTDHASIDTGACLPITLMPGESLRGLAYRVTSQSNVLLVPANSGTFALTAIVPPSSTSGDYADTPHTYGAAPDEHPIHQARELTDLRRLAFSYILGTYSTDPEDGAAVAMAEGPTLPGTKPIAYSLTNQRYNSTARVTAAASAEAARQRTLPVDAVIVTNPNLALEVHDIVEATEPRLTWSARRFRVRRIAEHYDHGKLTQTVYLGADSA